MFAAALPSEIRAPAAAAVLSGIRAEGGVRATFKFDGRQTRIDNLAEHGGYRMLFPHARTARAEAVLINSGGGVVGGDRVLFEINAGAGADAVVATQAAERIYRSIGPFSTMDVRLRAAEGARLAWMPQETILFSGARLRRRIAADIEESGALLLAEALVFGRVASGEVMRGGQLHDVWRVRRGGELILAEAGRLDDVCQASLQRPAVLAGAAATALVLYVSGDAEARLPAVRDAMCGARAETGASAWNGMLVWRCLAVAAADMRTELMRVIAILTDAPLPRVWTM